MVKTKLGNVVELGPGMPEFNETVVGPGVPVASNPAVVVDDGTDGKGDPSLSVRVDP